MANNELKVLQNALDGGPGYTVLKIFLRFQANYDWAETSLMKLIEDICSDQSLSKTEVMQPLRVAVTGTSIGISITDTLLILGRGHTLARIKRCIALNDVV